MGDSLEKRITTEFIFTSKGQFVLKDIAKQFERISRIFFKLQAQLKSIGSSFSNVFNPVNQELQKITARQQKGIDRLFSPKTIKEALGRTKPGRVEELFAGLNKGFSDVKSKSITFGQVVENTVKSLTKLNKVSSPKNIKEALGRTKPGRVEELFAGLKKGFSDVKSKSITFGQVVGKTVKGLTKQIDNSRKSLGRFEAGWLSIMFAGMAVQRTMSRILRSTLGTFSTVVGTVDGANTNISKLSAHFDFLKFSIGQAINDGLEPLLPVLIDMIDSFGVLIRENPEFVFKAIVGTFLAAGFAVVVSQFLSLVNGLIDLATKGNILSRLFAKIGKAVPGLSGVVKDLTALKGIGAIVLGVELAKDLFNGDFLGALADGMGLSGILLKKKGLIIAGLVLELLTKIEEGKQISLTDFIPSATLALASGNPWAIGITLVIGEILTGGKLGEQIASITGKLLGAVTGVIVKLLARFADLVTGLLSKIPIFGVKKTNFTEKVNVAEFTKALGGGFENFAKTVDDFFGLNDVLPEVNDNTKKVKDTIKLLNENGQKLTTQLERNTIALDTTNDSMILVHDSSGKLIPQTVNLKKSYINLAGSIQRADYWTRKLNQAHGGAT